MKNIFKIAFASSLLAIGSITPIALTSCNNNKPKTVGLDHIDSLQTFNEFNPTNYGVKKLDELEIKKDGTGISDLITMVGSYTKSEQTAFTKYLVLLLANAQFQLIEMAHQMAGDVISFTYNLNKFKLASIQDNAIKMDFSFSLDLISSEKETNDYINHTLKATVTSDEIKTKGLIFSTWGEFGPEGQTSIGKYIGDNNNKDILVSTSIDGSTPSPISGQTMCLFGNQSHFSEIWANVRFTE